MRSITYQGRNYTEFWAWLPIRTRSGQRIWMDYYYLRPNRWGMGVILSYQELTVDQGD